jgi:hypothetical protein
MGVLFGCCYHILHFPTQRLGCNGSVGESRSDFEREDAFSEGEKREQSGLAGAIRGCYKSFFGKWYWITRASWSSTTSSPPSWSSLSCWPRERRRFDSAPVAQGLTFQLLDSEMLKRSCICPFRSLFVQSSAAVPPYSMLRTSTNGGGLPSAIAACRHRRRPQSPFLPRFQFFRSRLPSKHESWRWHRKRRPRHSVRPVSEPAARLTPWRRFQ